MIHAIYLKHKYFQQIIQAFQNNETENVLLKNLSGSSFACFISNIFQHINNHIIVVMPDKESALYAYTDFINIMGNENNIFFFPSTFKRKLKNQHFDSTQAILRNETLQKVQKQNNSHILVTYPEAISEKVICKSAFQNSHLQIIKHEQIDLDFLIEILQTYQFEEVDFVFKPGQYAVRGAIVDLFSFSSEYPYRIEFDNDKVNSLRTFHIDTQQSLQILEEIQITPDYTHNYTEHLENSIIDYYEQKPVIFSYDTVLFEQQIKHFTTDRFIKNEDDNFFIPCYAFNELINIFSKCLWIECGHAVLPRNNVFSFNIQPQPAFNKNFDLLKDDIIQKSNQQYQIYLLVEQEVQKERLHDIFVSLSIDTYTTFVPYALSSGFIDHDLRIACYTEHQIFNRFYRHKVKDRFLHSDHILQQEFASLKPGDYVVHIDHGIGIFAGLEKIEINGKWQEQIKIVFKDNACVYMSVHNLHKISRYKGSDGVPPRLSKLGSGAWQKLKQQAKDKVKDIARDLIKLYSERMHAQGFAFSPDTYLQEELEASFFFEDTPDQAKATKAVKSDMEKPYPMDRLICGDVGFGKTEIAIRAAFKAVADNKQVAVLVPTTILALQHYLTFKERLHKFPCTVEFVSRLKSAKESKQIAEKLKKREIDIIIGTHKLLSKEFEFNDLGLLIIDEEQKFGVAAKEQIRKLKSNVDTLTLTATPIPRTLQFSLMGARDLSIIQTPPPNRQPIVTEIHVFNKDIIKNAIDFEISRGGQVFFIHNKIDNIYEIKRLIHELCPNVSIAIGHGRMKPAEIEQIILEFMQGNYDVLLSTTIIENGIDIPNANTIIINNGHMFGLSDLHQLRGRVGRTNRKAFCYILTPPLDTLPNDARKRLKAIEEYNELGSGFYIAMQDLDIRGAGNLLGTEQSGFIAEMGFETYQKILQEAIEEIKAEQQVTEYNSHTQNKLSLMDCTFESDLQLYIPEYYVENIAERIRLYKELDLIENEEQISVFQQSLIDRFGQLPSEVLGLFDVLKIRWMGQRIGFEKITLKANKLTCYFTSNKQSAYYDSKLFKNILHYLQISKKAIALKEVNQRLFLQFEKIYSIDQAIKILEELEKNVIIEV
ncbi:MAG: transcription-repair coupling factor [Bacteroidales bacterium]|nr:transcription-repair coupling factor [Bacteroidales bacterium]